MPNGFSFSVNPYKMIMMECPATGQPVATGINSAYFEEWNDSPPLDGASFTCPSCGQVHTFDRRNTWLDELNPSKRSGKPTGPSATGGSAANEGSSSSEAQAKPAGSLGISDGIRSMPRRLSRREKLGDGLFLNLQFASHLLFVLLGLLGYASHQVLGACVSACAGWLIGCWMRRSLGLRGRDRNLGFFKRQRERAAGARRGVLEWVIETVRGNAFTRAKSQAITEAYDHATEQMRRSSSVHEQEHILQWLDSEVKAISYD